MERIRRYKDCNDKEKLLRCNVSILLFLVFMVVVLFPMLFFFSIGNVSKFVLSMIVFVVYFFLLFITLRKRRKLFAKVR